MKTITTAEPQQTARLAAAVTVATLLAAFLTLSTHAVHAAGVGLQISPVRQFLSVDSGRSVGGSIDVTNNTGQPLSVTMSVQQFSVADYSYNYEFTSPANEWIRLKQTLVELPAQTSRTIAYTVSPPADAVPGGHYYTIIASARVSADGRGSTIQAAQPVYLTVNGQLLRTGKLNGSSLNRVAFGREITYALEPVNTGNVHFFAYLSGELNGMFIHKSADAGTHILIPGKPRRLTGSIPSPVLPGIYKVNFGYKTDVDTSAMVSKWIIYIPPWFIALLLAALLFSGKLLSRRQRKPKPNS